MAGDWSHFEVEEHRVKAFWADRELRRNGAGDSLDRRSEYRRWSAHQRIRSPPPSHRYLHHLQPPSPPFSSQHHLYSLNHIPTKPLTSILGNKQSPKYVSNPSPIHLYHHQPPSPSIHSRTHSHIPNQFHDHQNSYNPTCETQSTKTKSQSTKIHLQSDHQTQCCETHRNPNHQLANIHEKKIESPQNHRTRETSKPQNHIFTNINENQIEITDSHSTLLNSTNRCLMIPLDSKNLQQHTDFSHSENKLQMKTIMNENGGGCNTQWQFSATASSVCEVNTSKQNNFLVRDFTENISRCSAPNYSVISQMGQTHENLVGSNSNSKPKPTLHRNRPTTLVDMMQFVSEWFDFEENDNTSCDVLGDIVVDCDNSVQEKLVDCFDVVKNEEENDEIEFSISDNFIRPMT
ncbi:hypothetical protein Dsin_010293 [Dipteronia sinensis]|uniref:Uncharacterized protein n=1 Tax=Dipteronia sinensis TaxID=43782 RepID=A0AAE0ECF9_9ROSI|nr:hypothetical protein Dsin_010293 [Dipteronia sinensis]